MAQILLPTSDIAAGSWTTAPLWSKVDDDSTVNPSGDGTTIASADNASPDNADLGLASGTDPSSSTGHILRARWNKSASGGHAVNAVLELWQGTPGTGTLIATLTEAGISEVETLSEYTLTGTETDSITDYPNLNLRVSRQGETGGPPGNRRSLIVDLVEFEIPDAAAASGRVEASWAELESPDTLTRVEASWAEVETPESPTRLEASWTELETPEAPTRFDVSWAEFEAPSLTAEARLEVSWAELESPDTATGLQVSWAEIEMPESPTRLEVSWTELESPETPTRIEASWVELESLESPVRIDVSWAELQAGHSPTRFEASWAVFEVAEAGESVERKAKLALKGNVLVTGGG